MVGLVVVSHSAKAAEGICEVAAQMAAGVSIEPAGGEADGELGTSVDRISAAIDAAGVDGDGVVLLVDLGSAVMNAELAIEMSDAQDVRIADAPVLEAAVNAAVEANSPKATLDSVLEKAEEARDYRKLN